MNAFELLLQYKGVAKQSEKMRCVTSILYKKKNAFQMKFNSTCLPSVCLTC